MTSIDTIEARSTGFTVANEELTKTKYTDIAKNKRIMEILYTEKL